MRKVLAFPSRSYQQHNPSCFFGEHFGEAADGGVDLFAGYGLAVFSQVESLAVDGVCNLVRCHAAVPLHHYIYDGFFYFHHWEWLL